MLPDPSALTRGAANYCEATIALNGAPTLTSFAAPRGGVSALRAAGRALMKWLLVLCCFVAGLARAADGPEPGCLVVFGQGRNAAADDADANKLWDDVNIAFNAEVATRLQAAGERVVALVLRVSATDVKGNIDKLLARAASEHCRGIVETTMFADYAGRTLVARIRHHPLLAEAGGLRIGPPRYVVERNFELTRNTLDRVRPGALAQDMASELVERGLK